jgi:hypothetical protein
MVLMPGHIGALDAHVAQTSRIGVIAPDFAQTVLFDLDLEATVLRAENAARFFPFAHDVPLM